MNASNSECLQPASGRRSSRWIACLLLAFGAASRTPAQPPAISPEDEVLANLRNQRIGRQTLADLNLPEEFLRREADRIIRGSFEERYRIVVKDALAVTEDGQSAAPALSLVRHAAAGAIDVFEPPLTEQVLAYRKSVRKLRPSNRGFMPPLNESEAAWPIDEPDENAPEPVRDAADFVGRRLAFDGLPATLVHVLATLGPERFESIDDAGRAALRATGLPIDLLRHFTLGGGETGEAIIAHVARRFREGASIDEVLVEARAASFAFRASHPGFAVTDDAGSVESGVIRAQVTRGGYWRGVGDGGTTDLLRQAIAALPDVPFVASAEVKHARGFAEVAATWPLAQPRQLTLVIEPLEVQQWTQDNAKSGTIPASDVANLSGRSLAMLAPRYASWGDDGSTFLPGETFLLPGAAAAIGAKMIRSPLLFQGGNILCVANPVNRERLLLVADADIYRNTALGLTLQQAIDAFRVEFGCDRCVMLKAVSFHLDFDVSVRAMEGRLVALVNDPLPAARIVLECGTEALIRAGRLQAATGREAIEALRRGDHRAFLDRVANVAYAAGDGGRYPLSLAERFSLSPMDSAVGNIQRFLLALDYLVSLDLKPDEMSANRHGASYLQSLQRREREREALHQQLRELGMELHPVPSMSDATRGFAFLNGLQLKDAYLMPSYGGMYQPLDDAAERAIRAALGEAIRIARIECSESQRRSGAVRCSLSVFERVVGALESAGPRATTQPR